MPLEDGGHVIGAAVVRPRLRFGGVRVVHVLLVVLDVVGLCGFSGSLTGGGERGGCWYSPSASDASIATSSINSWADLRVDTVSVGVEAARIGSS